jgi:hypothetical protein
MKRILPMSLAALLLVAVAAEGAKWVLVFVERDGSIQVFMDVASITETSSGTLRAWRRVGLKQRAPSSESEAGHLLSYSEYDCAGRRHRLLQGAVYRTGATALDLGEEPGPWKFAIPETLDEALLNFLCQRGK